MVKNLMIKFLSFGDYHGEFKTGCKNTEKKQGQKYPNMHAYRY